MHLNTVISTILSSGTFSDLQQEIVWRVSLVMYRVSAATNTTGTHNWVEKVERSYMYMYYCKISRPTSNKFDCSRDRAYIEMYRLDSRFKAEISWLNMTLSSFSSSSNTGPRLALVGPGVPPLSVGTGWAEGCWVMTGSSSDMLTLDISYHSV